MGVCQSETQKVDVFPAHRLNRDNPRSEGQTPGVGTEGATLGSGVAAILWRTGHQYMLELLTLHRHIFVEGHRHV